MAQFLHDVHSIAPPVGSRTNRLSHRTLRIVVVVIIITRIILLFSFLGFSDILFYIFSLFFLTIKGSVVFLFSTLKQVPYPPQTAQTFFCLGDITLKKKWCVCVCVGYFLKINY
jgi:hypothetical protein